MTKKQKECAEQIRVKLIDEQTNGDTEIAHMNADELLSFMINKAFVYPEPGHIFYSSDQNNNGPEQHFRLNLAMPRSMVVSAMKAIQTAVKRL